MTRANAGWLIMSAGNNNLPTMSAGYYWIMLFRLSSGHP